MSGNHHFCEFTVHCLEYLGIFWQLLPDILRANKDIDENSPVLLHLQPLIDHDIDPSEFFSPALHCLDEVLHILALCFHTHEVEGVGIENFHHVVESTEYIVFLVGVEDEDLLGPVALDNFELLVDLELLLGDINDLLDFWLQLVELESQDIIEAEGGSLVVEFSSCLILQLLPVAILHVVSSQTLDQVQYDSHVAHLFSKGLPPLDESHLLVHTLDLVGEALVLLNQDIGLDLAPKFSLPVVVL